MAKAKKQSLSRAFKRGNAIMEFSMVRNQNVVVYRKRTDHNNYGGWRNRVKTNAMTLAMDDYCTSVQNYAKKQAAQKN